MDRTKWAQPEALDQVIFGYDIMGRKLSVFPSKEKAVASVEGLHVAEGDYRFFSSDGSALEARFSVPARMNENNTYSNGVYTLEPASSGQGLLALLSIVECQDEAKSGLTTLRDVEQFLIDKSLELSAAKTSF